MTFDIDANGIVNVSAKDKATNKEQSIRIQASGGLSDADIEQMVQDAEANAEADKERRAGVESRNQAEASIHQAEAALSEHGDKVSEEEKQAIEDAVTELKAVLEKEDASPDEINEAQQALLTASMKLGEAMYKAGVEAGGQDGPGGPEASDDADEDDGVVDADFEEVDGDKKD